MSTRDGNGPGPQESEHTDGRGPGPLRGHGAAGRSPRHDNGQTPQADEHTDGEDPGRPLHSHGTAAGSPRHDNGQAPPDNGHVGARGPDRPRTDHGSARGSAQNRSGRAPRTGEHTDVGHPDRPCTDPGGAGRRSARDEDGQAPQESEHTGACGPDRRRTDDGGTGLKPRSKRGRGPQRGGRARVGGPDRLRHRAVRFLRARPRVLLRLAGWSVLEAAQTFLLGYALARALDDGFLAGRAGVGLGWLAAAGVGVLVGAYGTGRVYRAVAALVEPLRDRLVTRVVERGVREGDGGALSLLGYLRADPVPEAELLAAAEAVGLAPLLDGLGGPAAVVDPAALSAGERQLIALTRAYLSHAPLALLDDATCHLDPEAEERAERAFAGRPGGTLVVVAHRISSARRAGQVLVMEGPRTVCGTHAEVLRRSPLYRELVGRWEPSSQPALPLRDTDGVDPVAGPGLAGDGRHVVAHGPVGQVQAPGDLRDRGALGREG